MSFEGAPSYFQKRGTLRIDLNPDLFFSQHGIASMGRRKNIFIFWMDFVVSEDSRGFDERRSGLLRL
jgi:hypothetical protein